MPQLDWDKFNQLPGSRHRNFEDLCRGMVRKQYGSLGHFRALKNQPGVEFHIELTESSPTLGGPPRWWGWQCKDHTRTLSGHLSAASKNDIKDSLEKTEKHLPNLTDWVLWTPYTLSKNDQKWFESLDTDCVLHMWAEEEIEANLDGPGLLLRQTYFGELVLVPDELAQQHEESIQPIKERWIEPVHQEVSAERELHQILGRVDAWDNFNSVGKRLAEDINSIKGSSASFDEEFTRQIGNFCSIGTEIAGSLTDFHGLLSTGDLEAIQQVLHARRTLIDKAVLAVPRKLRNLNLPISLNATNALDDMRLAIDLFASVEEYLGVGIVALLADAGGGKTQTAAQLTAPTTALPAGILLHGRSLHKGQSLDDIAASFRISGTPLESMEKLLAALDAAAKRAGCRLPIVIDGLNEAENPKEWKPYLASLSKTIDRYPNVVVICTLRTGERRRDSMFWATEPEASSRETFAELALPTDIRRIESEGFGENTADAVEKYFAFFKILPGESEIPLHLFGHPLTLRIFCQTANPDREKEITVEHFPASLWPLLESYLDHSCERISQLENLAYSYDKQEVRAAIHRLGLAIWDSESRIVCEAAFRSTVSDNDRGWGCSIVNLLAQEGIIFRNPGEQPGQFDLTPAYDALGGFIAARALLNSDQAERPFAWLRHSKFSFGALMAWLRQLFGDDSRDKAYELFVGEKSHELSTDIVRALVALTPLHVPGRQFWKELPASLHAAALRLTTEIDPQHIDQETVDALGRLLQDHSERELRLFGRLRPIRAVKDHPLNAEFLDRTLTSMHVSDRDISWTEWVRGTREDRLADVLALEQKWIARTERSAADVLVATWLKWLLSSTDRELRDVTTRALHWYGRGGPAALFGETLSSLSINDPYVPERMLAASYGTAMACYANSSASGESVDTLKEFARSIFSAMFADDAPRKTTHFLIRDYASRLVELASFHDSEAFTTEEVARSQCPYEPGALDDWGEVDAERMEMRGGDSPLQMDFENYTIGRLAPNRSNYDYKNAEYLQARAKILWRVAQLGWSPERFSDIDSSIARSHSLSRTVDDPSKTDRYGKKYSWIAYFELSGLLTDHGILDDFHENGRCSEIDLDPSFPERASGTQLVRHDYLGNPSISTQDWIENGDPPDLSPYLLIDQIDDQQGPWVILDGYVSQQDEERGRKTFIFVRTFLVAESNIAEFEKYLAKQDLTGRWLPEKPSFYYTFAGEIPWCSTYPAVGNSVFSFVESEEEVEVERVASEFLLDGEQIQPNYWDLLGLEKILKGEEQGGSDNGSLSDEELSRMEIRQTTKKSKEVSRKYKEYDALIPVCDFNWESYHSVTNNSGRARTLAKELAEQLQLRGSPQSFEVHDDSGALATFQTEYRPEDFFNSQSLQYLRMDLCSRFLSENGMCLVGAIWGEREYSVDQYRGRSEGSARPDPAYKVFSKIVRFDSDSGSWVHIERQ